MIVLDTTVLVYALGADHELQIPARRLVDAIGDGIVKAATTIEVIQEFVHVRSRRRSRREAADSALGYAALLAPLVRPNEADLQRALGLYADHPRLGAFDAVLAGTVLGAPHLTGIVSADLAFGSVAGLGLVDLAGVDVVERALALG